MRAAWLRAYWPHTFGSVVVTAVGIPAAVASYRHGITVVERSGDPAMAPWLPITTDGLLLASLVALWVRRLTGRQTRWPWVTFGLGLLVAIATNLAGSRGYIDHALGYWDVVEAVVWAVWPPVCLAVVLEIIAWIVVPDYDTLDRSDEQLADEVERAENAVGIPVTAASLVRPCHLYRLFDDEDTLLYVGIGWDVAARLRKHRDKKAWWSETTEVAVTTYPDRRSALTAEMTAIDQEAPLYNKLSGKDHDAAIAARMENGQWVRTPPAGWTPADPVAETARTPVDELTERRRTHADGEGTDGDGGLSLADESDEQLALRVAAWTAAEGSVPSRERVRVEFGIGSRRAARLREMVLTPEAIPDSSDPLVHGAEGREEAAP